MQQPLQQGTGGSEALVQVEGLGRGTSQHWQHTQQRNRLAPKPGSVEQSLGPSMEWNPGARRCGVRGVPLRAFRPAWKGPLGESLQGSNWGSPGPRALS